MLKRFCHGAAALSVSSECVEVILFGGRSIFLGTNLANTAVLRFGRSYNKYYYILDILTVFFHIHVVCNLIFHYSTLSMFLLISHPCLVNISGMFGENNRVYKVCRRMNSLLGCKAKVTMFK